MGERAQLVSVRRRPRRRELSTCRPSRFPVREYMLEELAAGERWGGGSRVGEEEMGVERVRCVRGNAGLLLSPIAGKARLPLD